MVDRDIFVYLVLVVDRDICLPSFGGRSRHICLPSFDGTSRSILNPVLGKVDGFALSVGREMKTSMGVAIGLLNLDPDLHRKALLLYHKKTDPGGVCFGRAGTHGSSLVASCRDKTKRKTDSPNSGQV